MEIELVWLENKRPVVQYLRVEEPLRFDKLFELLPSDVRETLSALQACRFSKKIQAATLVMPGDQIAWLPQVTVDPQAARVARVEKQRKERWRLKSIPKLAVAVRR
jgi:putative ubiquitin-RnfH superfamily antitoxin RatB of RatAB toxin-antitoxin module